MLTTILDLLGGACLVAFAYLGFTAIGRALGVAGALILLVSWRASR